MTIPEALAIAVERHQQGRLDVAEQIYRQVLQVDPLNADANHLFGVIALQTNHLDTALDSIGRAIQSNPSVAPFHGSLGDAYRAQQKLPEAIACYRQALALDPRYAKGHAHLGIALMNAGDLDEAIASYRRALDLSPGDASVLNNLGIAFLKQEKLDDAIAAYRQALRIDPHFAETHHNLGIVLMRQKSVDEAEICFRRAIELKPDYVEAHNNLGNALHEQERYEEAIDSYRRAAHLRPTYADVSCNLGSSFNLLGNWDESERHFEAAIRLQPDFPEARANLGLLRLLRGDFARGWPDYEQRFRARDYLSPRRNYSQPQWDGGPLNGQTILLHSEQGLGDTIQFVRFAPLVQERGGRVLVSCQPQLVRLLGSCRGIDQLISDESELPAFDVHAPLLSLPGLLGLASVNDIPASVPYLRADPELVQRWRSRMESIPGFRVGIAWQGSPHQSRDRWRSVPLERFAPLAEVPGVRLVSLQKGFGSEQLQKLPGLAVDLGSELTDMADTAAVMSGLDLVISTCTSVVHLAGGLGVPVWIALAFVADWRWHLDRTDSPWYPTARLFRQPRHRDWDDVFERLTAAVRDRSPHHG